jgi:hypothetical protein
MCLSVCVISYKYLTARDTITQTNLTTNPTHHTCSALAGNARRRGLHLTRARPDRRDRRPRPEPDGRS